MASQQSSRIGPRQTGLRSSLGIAAPGTKSGALLQRLRAALTRAYRQRMGFKVARHQSAGAQVRPELEHSLSWRFGVPVR